MPRLVTKDDGVFKDAMRKGRNLDGDELLIQLQAAQLSAYSSGRDFRLPYPLGSAFTWRASPQGHEYWERINEGRN